VNTENNTNAQHLNATPMMGPISTQMFSACPTDKLHLDPGLVKLASTPGKLLFQYFPK